VGGLAVGLLFRFVARRQRPSTVADVIAANAFRSGRMSFRRGIKTALLDAVSIGVGASVGREGPAVHLGAALGGWCAKTLRLTRALSRTVMGCGVAAAVAASFNAPIAGALFANEVIIGHYGLSAFAPIVLASVVGTMASRAYFGDYPAFIIAQHPGFSFVEIPAFLVLGVLAAVAAIAFIRGTAGVQRVAQRVPGPAWLRPMVGGFLVGAIALAVPQVLGLGYGVTDDAMRAVLPLGILAAAFLGKLLATILSIGFGFGGGVFSPSLVIGAMLGGTYGTIVTQVLPGLSSGPTAYTVVGMGAVAAAVLGAPISTTLIIFEMTGDYALTLAVMVAVVVSSVITKQVTGHSHFTYQLACRGVDLKAGFESALLRGIRVRDVMEADCVTVGAGVHLPEVRARLLDSRVGEVFVVRGDGTLLGTVTLPDLSDMAFDSAFDDLITASDVARLHPPAVAANADLETALEAMRRAREEHIAVVDSLDTMVLRGCVHERDVVMAYNQALVDNRREEHE
jgi:CIC family chloride channel protein